MWPSTVGEPPSKGARERVASYADMPWVFALADKVASAGAAVPWTLNTVRRRGQERATRMKALQGGDLRTRRRIYRELKSAGELVPVEDHPFLDMMESGNSMITGIALRKLMFLYWDLEGEVFLLKDRGALGVPRSIWPIPPDWVRLTPTPANPNYMVSFRGWQGWVPETEFTWMQNHNPSNPYGRGTGIVRALADEVETDEYAARTMRMVFLNTSRPDFIVYPKNGESMNEPERLRLQTDWEQQHQGFWRAFRARIASKEMGVYEFQPTDHRRLQMTQLREFERDLIRQCHDTQTQALTRRGWVFGTDLLETDEIATWDEEKQRLEWRVPDKVVRYPHDGPMHYWHNDRVDVAVTPDHRMYVWSPRGMQFMTSEESAQTPERHWQITCPQEDDGVDVVEVPFVAYERSYRKRAVPPGGSYRIDAVTFARWLGYWLAEGSSSKVPGRFLLSCSQTTPTDDLTGITLEMHAATRAVVDTGIGRFRTRRHNRLTKGGRVAWEFNISDKSLWTWLSTRCGDSAPTKRLPREAMTWCREAQLALLNAIVDGDGHRTRPGYFWVGTTSRQLADDIQELATIIGLHAAVHAVKRAEKSAKHHQPYTVTVDDHKTTVVHRRALDARTYSGEVWCVQVGGRAFVTRRNGKVALHGNCWGVPPEVMGIVQPGASRATIDRSSYLFSRWVLLPRLELIRAILQQRLVPEFDERLVLDYVSPVEEDKDFALDVAKAAPWTRDLDEWRAMQDLDPLEGGRGKLVAVPVNIALRQPGEASLAPDAQPSPPGQPDQPGQQDRQRLARLTTAELYEMRRLRAKMDGAEERPAPLDDPGLGAGLTKLADAITSAARPRRRTIERDEDGMVRSIKEE